MKMMVQTDDENVKPDDTINLNKPGLEKSHPLERLKASCSKPPHNYAGKDGHKI